MKLELAIMIITGFFVMNIYHDNKYIEMMKGWKKYYQMGTIIFLALSLYIFMKKNPRESNNMARHMAGMIKHMPIDKKSKDIITPFLSMSDSYIPPQQKRMLNSGGNTNKRCVSGTKKKYVAAQQNWKCGKCGNQLNAWFEVDHKIELEDGGSNHVTNLEALCKECHGEKTGMKRM